MKAKQIAAAMLALLALAAASPMAGYAGPVKPLCGAGSGPTCSG
jgi:hypothetical protein